MTVRDAVELFGISKSYLKRRLREGEIPAKKHQGAWVIRGADFRNWLKTQPMYRHWYIEVDKPTHPNWDLLDQEEQIERMLKYIDSTTLDL